MCLVLSTPLWAEEPSDLAEDNGFAIGRTLSDYYSGEAKERFIRGLLAGLQNSEDTASIAEPSAWFDAPERTRQERASYAAGYLSAETYASPEMPYSMFNYLQGFADSAQNAGPGLEIERLSKVVNDYQRAEFYKLKRQVAERMQAAPAEAARVRLPVGFVRQHHITCAPATLAMLGTYWGQPADHEQIVFLAREPGDVPLHVVPGLVAKASR